MDLDEHTEHPRAVNEILDTVKAQVLTAFAVPFFDGGGAEQVSPSIKVGIVEAGTVHISAKHIDPPYRADVTLDIRTDLEAAKDCRYQIRGRCEITRDGKDALLHREFALGVSIADDGSVTIDIEQLRAELAGAIRSLAEHSASI